MEVCCGGIIGMGESCEQRAEFAAELAELGPDEVPLNFLNPRPGHAVRRPGGDAGQEALRWSPRSGWRCPAPCCASPAAARSRLGDLGAKQGMLGGINAVIVGNYLTTLGRPAEADLQLLDDLQMPIKALNASL